MILQAIIYFLFAQPMIIKENWIWEEWHSFSTEKSRIFCWALEAGIFQWHLSGDLKAIAHPQDISIHLPASFLDKIGTGVWKADFTLKAKSLSLWMAWQWASCRCNRSGHHRSADTPPPEPAQPDTESSTASSHAGEGSPKLRFISPCCWGWTSV